MLILAVVELPMKILILNFPILLLSFFFSVGSFAAVVQTVDTTGKNLVIKLSPKDTVKTKKGMSLIVSGSKRRFSRGYVTKVSGKRLQFKITKGYKSWKRNSKVKIAISKSRSFTSNMFSFYQQRLPKRYSVMPEVGTSVFPVPAYGITGSYGLNNSLAVELNFSKGSLRGQEERGTSDPFGLDSNLETQVISARAKKMWGRSLYSNGGLGLRTVTYTGSASDIAPEINNVSDGEDLFVLTREDLVLDLAVGNKWKYKGITLGADWLGLLIPISTQRNDSSLVGSGPDSGESADASSDDASTVDYRDYYYYELPGASYQGKLYIGYSF